MIKVNVRTVKSPPPKGEELIIKDADISNEDYSGKNLIFLYFSNNHFYRCKFENMKVTSITLGVRDKQSVFTECSFDRSDLSGLRSSNAKFIRCSFRDIKFNNMFFFCSEFVDCVFSGKIKKTVFYRELTLRDKQFSNREFNEFHDNDFSEARFDGVEFRGGVDLTLQKLPQGEKYLYIRDAVQFIKNFEGRVNCIGDGEFKKSALICLKLYKEDLATGQTQFFLRLDEVTIDLPYLNQMAELVKQAAIG